MKFALGNQLFSSCPSVDAPPPVCFGPMKNEVLENQHDEDLFHETIGRDFGGDNVPVFPSQEDEEDYEQLYGTNSDGNYNADHDHVGFDLGDVGHDDVDDDGLDDNQTSCMVP